MAIEFYIHKMTEHMDTARIVRWLVKEGTLVSKGQVILEVETEKAVSEVEAPGDGFLRGIREGAIEGCDVSVGETIAFIVKEGEEVPSLPPLGKKKEELLKGDEVLSKPKQNNNILEPHQIRATPVARRLAKEAGIDISRITGSSEGGRIGESDVRLYLTKKSESSQDDWLELTPSQRLTGIRMTESIKNIPQFSVSIDIDLSTVIASKDSLVYEDKDGKEKAPSFTAILIRQLSLSLKVFPRCNSSFVEGRIKLFNRINIGVAVGTDSGLYVPVIKDADSKTISTIAQELNTFQDKAKNQHFSEKDLTDGTFTLSNLGMYGVDRFNAIINPPQSAILAVGRIKNELVGISGNEALIRPVASFTLSVDHRVMDGLYAANFLKTLEGRLAKWQKDN